MSISKTMSANKPKSWSGFGTRGKGFGLLKRYCVTFCCPWGGDISNALTSSDLLVRLRFLPGFPSATSAGVMGGGALGLGCGFGCGFAFDFPFALGVGGGMIGFGNGGCALGFGRLGWVFAAFGTGGGVEAALFPMVDPKWPENWGLPSTGVHK